MRALRSRACVLALALALTVAGCQSARSTMDVRAAGSGPLTGVDLQDALLPASDFGDGFSSLTGPQYSHTTQSGGQPVTFASVACDSLSTYFGADAQDYATVEYSSANEADPEFTQALYQFPNGQAAIELHGYFGRLGGPCTHFNTKAGPATVNVSQLSDLGDEAVLVHSAITVTAGSTSTTLFGDEVCARYRDVLIIVAVNAGSRSRADSFDLVDKVKKIAANLGLPSSATASRASSTGGSSE